MMHQIFEEIYTLTYEFQWISWLSTPPIRFAVRATPRRAGLERIATAFRLAPGPPYRRGMSSWGSGIMGGLASTGPLTLERF